MQSCECRCVVGMREFVISFIQHTKWDLPSSDGDNLHVVSGILEHVVRAGQLFSPQASDLA